VTEKVRYGLMTEAAFLFFAGRPSAVADPWQFMLAHAKETEASS